MKRKRIIPLLFVLFGLSANSCGNSNSLPVIPSVEEQKTTSKNNSYTNPIYPYINGEQMATYTADPFVFKDGDTYYMYCTQTDIFYPEGGKSFVRGPIFESNNLTRWDYVGDVFGDYIPNWGTSGAGVWAPTIIKIGDTYNYYYSLSIGGDENPGIGVATSKSPTGPFEHHGKLFNSEEIGVTNSIDPYVFYDEDKLYMVFGSYGGLITIVELEEDGLSLKGGVETQNKEKHAIAGYELFENNNYEASIIFKEYGKYYLLLSTGSTLSGLESTYRVVVASSDSLFGPYTDSEGKDMFGPNRGDNVVAPSLSKAMGVGHCTVVQDDMNNYWMLYHGYVVNGEEPTYRSLMIDQILFDPETRMPYVQGNTASIEEKVGPYINSLEK